MAHDCFADEVAIDFPHVGRVVARMRAAFDVADDVVKAELRLSRREAVTGGLMSLDVPIRATCATCGGRGESWAECCDECGGTGASIVPHAVRVPVPPGVADGACFRFRVSSQDAPPVRVEVRVAIGAPAV